MLAKKFECAPAEGLVEAQTGDLEVVAVELEVGVRTVKAAPPVVKAFSFKADVVADEGFHTVTKGARGLAPFDPVVVGCVTDDEVDDRGESGVIDNDGARRRAG